MKNSILIILILILAACSSGGGKIPDKTYYRLAEPKIHINTQSITKIQRPSALGILGSRPIVAENNQGGMVQMNHNLWLESPKVLLNNYLIKVFKLNDSQDGGNILSVEILHLEKKQTTAIIEIKFIILNQSDEIVFNKTYRQDNPMVKNSIVDFVHAINLSLNTIVQQLENDLP